jgi:hypothetical protein
LFSILIFADPFVPSQTNRPPLPSLARLFKCVQKGKDGRTDGRT